MNSHKDERIISETESARDKGLDGDMGERLYSLVGAKGGATSRRRSTGRLRGSDKIQRQPMQSTSQKRQAFTVRWKSRKGISVGFGNGRWCTLDWPLVAPTRSPRPCPAPRFHSLHVPVLHSTKLYHPSTPPLPFQDPSFTCCPIEPVGFDSQSIMSLTRFSS